MKPEELNEILEKLLSESRSRFIYNLRDLLDRDWGYEIAKFVSKDLASGGKSFIIYPEPNRKEAAFRVRPDRAPIYEVPYAYFFLVFEPFIMLKDFTVDYPQIKASFYVSLRVNCYFNDVFKLIEELSDFRELFKRVLGVDNREASSWASKFADRVRKRIWYFVREPNDRLGTIDFEWKIKEAVYKILSPANRELALQKIRYKGTSTPLEIAVNEVDLRKVIMGQFEGFKDVAKELAGDRYAGMKDIAIVVYKFLLKYIEEVLKYVERYTKEIAHDFLNDVLLNKVILNALFEKGGVWDEVDLQIKV